MATNYSFSNLFKPLVDPFANFIKAKPLVPTVPTAPRIGQQAAPPAQPNMTPLPSLSQNQSMLGATPQAPSPAQQTPFKTQPTPQITAGAMVPPPAPAITPPVAPQTTPDASAAPAAPAVPPETAKAITDGEKAIAAGMAISPEELSTQADLDRLAESTRKAYISTSDQTIPLEFITGELASIERRALALAEPLERKMARLQSTRTASLEASKFALERQDKKAEAATAAGKPVSVTSGTTLVDPKTGKAIFTGPRDESKAPTTIETAQGIQQWDPQTGSWKSTGFTKPVSETAQQKAGENADKATAAAQAAGSSIGILNNLLAGNNYKAISGAAQTGSIPWIGNPQAKNQYDQLKAQLALGARALLKGSGAVSDYEAKVLENSTSSLGRNLGEAEFQKALLTVRGVLKTNQGLETEVKVTNPQTGEVVTTSASGQEIYSLVTEGNTIEYL